MRNSDSILFLVRIRIDHALKKNMEYE
jgi:hypothetical protein